MKKSKRKDDARLVVSLYDNMIVFHLLLNITDGLIRDDIV